MLILFSHNYFYTFIWKFFFRSIIVFASVVSGGFFLHDNTSEFLKSTVQTTLDSMVPLSQVSWYQRLNNSGQLKVQRYWNWTRWKNWWLVSLKTKPGVMYNHCSLQSGWCTLYIVQKGAYGSKDLRSLDIWSIHK